MPKYCKYVPERRCFHSSCSVFNRDTGMVEVCKLHPSPDAFFMSKKVVPVCPSIFSKHLRSGRRVGVDVV